MTAHSEKDQLNIQQAPHDIEQARSGSDSEAADDVEKPGTDEDEADMRRLGKTQAFNVRPNRDARLQQKLAVADNAVANSEASIPSPFWA